VAVKIKLKRMGKIHAPYYRIVVADARTKRDGRAIEEIGKYHPKSEPSYIEVASERAQYWLSVGAQPTEPVRRILEITGDWQKFRGEPGAEGTLRTAAPKTGKSERFAEALSQNAGAGTETAPKGRARAAKTGAKTESKAEAKTESKADAKAGPKADAKKKPAAKAAKADKPAEPAAAAPEPAAAAPEPAAAAREPAAAAREPAAAATAETAEDGGG
jgi:small subunit ribosomal protein S16